MVDLHPRGGTRLSAHLGLEVEALKSRSDPRSDELRLAEDYAQPQATRESTMAHHLDSPLARQDIRLDITDLYAFRGETGTVLAIDVCHSIGGHIPTPGYHPEGMYEIKLDLNGDAVEDLTYRFVFDERDPTGTQRFVLTRLSGADAANPDATGTILLTGSTDESISTSTGLRTWAGKASDPFWIEPDVLHAVGHAFQDGTVVDLSGWDRSKAHNLFAGHTVYSIVLEIPDEELLGLHESTHQIGVWALATLATDSGGWRSINRVGLPMVHPLLTQFNEPLGDRLNAGRPSDDFEMYGEVIIKAVADVVAAYGSVEDPRKHAETVARRLLPNVLPYTVGTPAGFTFNEWNGRSLIDNVADVVFTMAANTPIGLGIGRESVRAKPRSCFPYMPPVGDVY